MGLVLERRVEVVGNLDEAVGRVVVALLVHDVDFDAPFLHGKIGHGRRFGAGSA